MFTTSTNSDGITSAVVDFSAVSTSGLGNLISGIAARLNDTDVENMSFETTTLDTIFNANTKKTRHLGKFSTMALALNNDGYGLETEVEVAAEKGIKVIRVLADQAGYKSIKNKMVSL